MKNPNQKVDTTSKEGEPNKKTRKFPDLPKELGGRKGPEPTRYGDWEKDGITSDF